MTSTTPSTAHRLPDEIRPSNCVLVVDDDLEIVEMMVTILRRSGFAVETAGNGREALDRVRTLRPALILLDIHMPIMDGAEFRQAQRRDPELIRIPTIVMTAACEEPLLDLAIEETLRKPVRAHDLLRIVRSHCVPVVDVPEGVPEDEPEPSVFPAGSSSRAPRSE